MLEQEGTRQEGITVEEFARSPELGLELELVCGGQGLSNKIRSPRIQKLGLALAGFTDYIHPERVQLLGGSEINYLKIMDPEASRRALRGLLPLNICCIVVTKGLPVPEGLAELAREGSVALLRTQALSSVAITRISEYLEAHLALRTTIHGVLMEVFGLGVLIMGPSGIGKSECALELVLRGHRLIADDSVQITRRSIDRLVGSGAPVLRHHMELRGLGIIDIKELFGISATGISHELGIVVRLEKWQPHHEYDRLGIDQAVMKILDVPLPMIIMPVAPGRNMSTLVEVAARNHLLRRQGCQLPKELQAREAAGDAADGSDASMRRDS